MSTINFALPETWNSAGARLNSPEALAQYRLVQAVTPKSAARGQVDYFKMKTKPEAAASFLKDNGGMYTAAFLNRLLKEYVANPEKIEQQIAAATLLYENYDTESSPGFPEFKALVISTFGLPAESGG